MHPAVPLAVLAAVAGWTAPVAVADDVAAVAAPSASVSAPAPVSAAATAAASESPPAPVAPAGAGAAETTAASAAASASPGPAAGAEPGTESGAARLDLLAEPRRLRLRLALPQGSLVGFPGAPRDDAERAESVAALARLGDAANLFQVDPAAGCGPARVHVDAGPLAPGQGGAAGAGTPAPEAPHDAAAPGPAPSAGVAARYEFDCTAADAAAWLDAPLLQHLPRLRLVHVQLSTPRGPGRAMLSRPLTRIPLR